ncbi:MAG TPA: hypothetical protein DDZ96_13530 [Porphyromonadaceae bacterium]|jgi:hypothetical protein|uniref:nucleotidyltransferase domain-containing protein n=1 Tax=Limibacterium fermenti TaxID=3229863 RepID=UPI000E87FE0B|nr:hypothetical protein [Porphyromonadaceae bacterium]HBK31860.1 hypothetical protein [Porphyromonadaceae bacterium]HBL34816.1 hypothetical protein [Porphyromonadaceae bacterium]HBX20547.1 hypothetical protein [Porphyromonadaceae bacterium]HBX45778.1 hypothetical protein [Porphyromonadaceae bacterium]
MKRLETYLSDIVVLCKKHKVKSLYAFGSVLNEGLHPESDIDFIVGFLFIGSSSGLSADG